MCNQIWTWQLFGRHSQITKDHVIVKCVCRVFSKLANLPPHQPSPYTDLGWLGVTQQHWTLAFNVVFTDFGVSNSLNFLPLMTQVYLAARLLPFNLSKHRTNISSPLLVHLLRYLRYKLILTQYSISQGYRLVLSEVHPPAHLLPPSTCQNIRLTFWVYYWFIYTLGILLSYKYYTSVSGKSYFFLSMYVTYTLLLEYENHSLEVRNSTLFPTIRV